MAVLGLWAVCNGNAQTDTVQVNRPGRVTIITSEREQSIEIEGSAENPAYHFSRTTALDAGASSVTREKLANVDFNFPFKRKRQAHDRFEVGGIAFGLSTALGAPSRLVLSLGQRAFVSIGSGCCVAQFPDEWTESVYQARREHRAGRLSGRRRYPIFSDQAF